MQSKIKGLIERIKKIKHKEYILAVFLGILVLLIFFSQMKSGGKTSENTATVFSPQEYAESLETKLEKVLKKMDGAGNTTVVVTVASGMQSIPYVKEDGTVLQSGGKVVILKESYPEVIGVVIISEGANSYLTKMQITGATCALLNISEERVRVYPKAS